jgi:hypothetical protein
MPRIAKKDAERLLGNVVGDHVFRYCDGRVIASMPELEEALNAISDETYSYHANAEKNDFANWAREVIGDQKLANDLVKSAGRAQAAKAVANRVAFLKEKLQYN